MGGNSHFLFLPVLTWLYFYASASVRLIPSFLNGRSKHILKTIAPVPLVIKTSDFPFTVDVLHSFRALNTIETPKYNTMLQFPNCYQ